jgi:ribosomal protein S18 acetylase RimI-like enzyme
VAHFVETTGAMVEAGLPMLELRAVRDEDLPFVRLVYASSREEELALVPWSEEQCEAFLDMQFQAQLAGYSSTFPESDHSVVMVDGQQAGRIWVARSEAEIRLVDLALLPAFRNFGIGTALVRRLQAEAQAASTPLRHCVWTMNGAARRLYLRLGFTVVEDQGMYQLMEWRPAAG